MVFKYKGYQIEYDQFGNGPVPLLAFHGFGQNPSVFRNLQPSLNASFTTYSLGLFHHGQSVYPAGMSNDEPVSAEFFVEMVDRFCSEHNINEMYLLGYSLGGRLALQYIQLRPERVKGLILMAPDGIKKSFWYHFATQNPRGKILFRKMVDRPDLFFRLVKYLKMMGIVNGKMQRFIHSQFSDERNRKMVFNVWNSYSTIVPRVAKTRETIRNYKIPTVVFTGTYDPVINKSIGKIITGGLEDLVFWQEIKAGHDLLKEGYNENIYPVIQRKLFKMNG